MLVDRERPVARCKTAEIVEGAGSLSGNDNRFVAMVAAKRHVRIQPDRAVKRLKELFPGLASDVGDPPQEEGEIESFAIPVGDAVVLVMQLPFAIPPETLNTALENELMWREAKKAFAASKAHVLVSIIAANEDPRLARKHAQILTCATAAILSEIPASAVYWSTGEMVVEPSRFLSEAKTAGNQRLPSDLWVTFRFFKGETFDQDQAIVARTSGLEAFVGREVECGPYVKQPGELAQTVRQIADYILQTGADFSDGHTIGDDGKLSARITLEWSQYGADNKPIYRVNLE